MKKTLIIPSIAIFTLACSSTRKGTRLQETPPAIVPPMTDTLRDTVRPEEPVFAGLRDSASYAIGVFVVNFYKQQGISDINSAMVAKAIDDNLQSNSSLLDDNQANTAIMTYINNAQAEKAKVNIEAGEKFLEENKKRPGVVTTASGLQYEIISEGNGPKPTAADSVTCHYRGTYIDGTEFDASYKRGEPVTFSVTGVIKGWTEALLLMPAGSRWKLYIPYQLGYGINDYYSIPGGSVLVFEIELLAIPNRH